MRAYYIAGKCLGRYNISKTIWQYFFLLGSVYFWCLTKILLCFSDYTFTILSIYSNAYFVLTSINVLLCTLCVLFFPFPHPFLFLCNPVLHTVSIFEHLPLYLCHCFSLTSLCLLSTLVHSDLCPGGRWHVWTNRSLAVWSPVWFSRRLKRGRRVKSGPFRKVAPHYCALWFFKVAFFIELSSLGSNNIYLSSYFWVPQC